MKEFTGDALERRVATSLAPTLGIGADVTALRDKDSAAAWRRVNIADGIEIHVREDSPAARESSLVAMREALRATLGREDVR